MNYLSKIWLASSFLFNPVQKFFNGNFWESFEKKFGKFKGKNVLDIACGTGELKKHISPKHYLGVDLNKSYIKLCKEKLETKNVRFVLADATKIIIDSNYDSVFFVGSIHHFTDSQVKKLLKNLTNKKVKQIIICDGIPQGLFEPLLVWLDAFLGGGKYFRTEKKLSSFFARDFQIEKQGRLKTSGSFYVYPFWVLSQRRR